MTTPIFPSAEALRRLRLLSAHQYRHAAFDLAYGGDDPDDPRLAAEVAPLRRYPTSDIYGNWSLGLQGSSDLNVKLPDTTLPEVEAILDALRPYAL